MLDHSGVRLSPLGLIRRIGCWMSLSKYYRYEWCFVDKIYMTNCMYMDDVSSPQGLYPSSSTEWLLTLMLQLYMLLRSLLDKPYISFSTASLWLSSLSLKANLPNNWFLWLRMSLRLAVELRECPDGNITKPDSYFWPPLRVTLIEVGMPSGYFSSYDLPPWVKVHLVISSRV